MVNRSITNKKLMRKLEEIKIENKKMEHITLLALGFAIFAVTIPLLYDIIPPSNLVKISIIIIYLFVSAYFIFLAKRVRINNK